MHIGLIGGIGPSSTEYYYRHLVRAQNEAGHYAGLTISHANLKVMLANMLENNAERQAEIFLEHVIQLQGAGAKAVAVTSLGGHFCIQQLEARSPVPILNLIPILNDYFSKLGLKRVGIMGTASVMQSRFYGGISSVDIVVPPGEQLQKTNDHYLAMAAESQASDFRREFFFETGKKMCDDQGADVVILAGTDLFLAFDEQECGFPVIDAALIHVDAIHQAMMT